MAKLLCMLCGMPAIGMLKGTSVCNNNQCQEAAGLSDLRLEHLSPSPPAPLENKYHTGRGEPRRVAGPNEVPALQGVLRKGPTGAELWVPDVGQVVRICPSSEIFEIVEFLRDNFPNEWLEILRTREYGDVDDLRAMEPNPPERVDPVTDA